MFKVITHSQQFHIDEVMAIALLDLYFLNENYSIIRANRKDILIDESKLNDKCFVIDVGFEYNPELLNFDHHQNSNDLCWNDGLPYSSCGLVWQWLKSKSLSNFIPNDVIIVMEEKLIRKIDKHDNGIELWDDGNFISIYNRKTDDSKIQDIQFLKAVNAAKDYIENIVIDIKNNIKADQTILKYIKNSDNIEDIVIFNSNVPNGAVRVSELTPKELVIIPRTKHSWTIQSVPENSKDIFSIKCPSPISWRGLSDEELSNVSGIANMIFCHKNGYVTMVNGSLDDALKVARIIIDNNKHF